MSRRGWWRKYHCPIRGEKSLTCPFVAAARCGVEEQSAFVHEPCALQAESKECIGMTYPFLCLRPSIGLYILA